MCNRFLFIFYDVGTHLTHNQNDFLCKFEKWPLGGFNKGNINSKHKLI